MRQVAREEFFAVVGGPRNVHPRPEKDHSLWIDQRTHEVVGRSEPGYLNPGDPHAYYLTEGIR